MKRQFFRRITLYALWLFAIGTATVSILDYENASGSVGSAPEQWVFGTPVPLDPTRDTLILFAHPRCPCTRATLEDLNRVLAQSNGRIAAHVLFFSPAHYPANWAHTELWRSAAAIPGVTVGEDTDNALAREYGAATSGYVLLYNPRGELLFRGGITGSGDHDGDNVAERAIISLATGGSATGTQTPVYGCSLFGGSNCQPGVVP
ncbi:MAG: hypothetical protein ACREFR_09700 [Limisphaerales bacterium]